jgi:hypothetical protein
VPRPTSTNAPTSHPTESFLAGVAPHPKGLSTEEVAAILSDHNKDRARFGSVPLVWNTTLASIAQNHASHCNFHKNKNLQVLCGGTGCGENIAASISKDFPTTTARYSQWASEEAKWNCSAKKTGTCSQGDCEHWTQIVWSTTTQVGCGRAQCAMPTGGHCLPFWSFLVCVYSGPGNLPTQLPVAHCDLSGRPAVAAAPAACGSPKRFEILEPGEVAEASGISSTDPDLNLSSPVPLWTLIAAVLLSILATVSLALIMILVYTRYYA